MKLGGVYSSPRLKGHLQPLGPPRNQGRRAPMLRLLRSRGVTVVAKAIMQMPPTLLPSPLIKNFSGVSRRPFNRA